MPKPILDATLSPADFKRNYWLKQELSNFCRTIGINTSGGKIEISNRVLRYLETGIIVTTSEIIPKKATSNFDWNSENLSLETVISDNYKNTESVRRFFRKSIGSHFKFNVAFMDWMKASTGKTLGDAVEKWNAIREIKKDKNYTTEIAPQFEYNTYIRDFLKDNPTLATKDAIKSWKIKREKPEHKKYNKNDLQFLK